MGYNRTCCLPISGKCSPKKAVSPPLAGTLVAAVDGCYYDFIVLGRCPSLNLKEHFDYQSRLFFRLKETVVVFLFKQLIYAFTSM